MVLVSVMSAFVALPPLSGADAPGPFRFAATETLKSVLQSGGFSTFEIENRTMTFDFPSVEAYLQIVSEVAGRPKALSTPTTFPKTRRRASLPSA
jgi:hypothetical protein